LEQIQVVNEMHGETVKNCTSLSTGFVEGCPTADIPGHNYDIPIRYLPTHVLYSDLALNCNLPERTATKALLDSEPKPEPGCWTSA
jgi:hypothetical protein